MNYILKNVFFIILLYNFNMSDKKKISASLEDYLEAIYQIIQENGSVKAIDVSKRLNVSRASVTEAFQMLALKGYVKYNKYQPIELTDLGVGTAKEVIYKHDILYKFFHEFLELNPDEAVLNACKIEHIITTVALEKLKKVLKM